MLITASNWSLSLDTFVHTEDTANALKYKSGHTILCHLPFPNLVQ